ncbi:hypothetical protein EDE12_1187 [Methylosinus sp. sav-2]|uniref:hypothetical protein n=1 Tax=Methylosinus sp. sav-2 TaxID=2485168 RepID=UPI000689FAAC|nr:hypothetical protein [Methylosinus sp. sav-2]TDX60771.1 hypothetical protein EDE12_1187 [Methylosinus sp. sav-2]
MSRESDRKSALPLGPATVEGVEVVTIPLTEYADLLSARRQLAKLRPAGRRPRKPRLPAPPTSPIDADPEISAFLAARLGKMTQKAILATCIAEFGPRRAPTKSSIHRFYQRHFLPQAARPVKAPAIPQDLT